MNTSEEMEDEAPKIISMDESSIADSDDKRANSTSNDSKILSGRSSTSDLGLSDPRDSKVTTTSSSSDVLVTEDVDLDKTSSNDIEDNDVIIGKIDSLLENTVDDDEACSDLIDEDLKLHWDEEEETDNPDKIQGAGIDAPTPTSEVFESKSLQNPKTIDLNNAAQEIFPINNSVTYAETTVENLGNNENASNELDESINKHAKDTIICQSSEVETSMNLPLPHGLMKPDQMIEIPTQELIDIDDSCLLDDTSKMVAHESIEDDNLEDLEAENKHNENMQYENIENENIEDEKSAEEKLIAVAKSCDTTLLEDTITIDSSDHEENDVISIVTKKQEEKYAEIIDDTIEDREPEKKISKNDETLSKSDDLTEVSLEPKVSVPGTVNSDINVQSMIEENKENSKDHENMSLEMKDEVTDLLDSNKDVNKIIGETNEPNSPRKSDESEASNSKATSVFSSLNPKPTISTAEELEAADTEVTEVDDSLGLLAESSRMMEDEDDEDEAEADADAEVDDDDDGDPEYDPDEDSNQVSCDQSEDSNAPQSEMEQPKDGTEVTAEDENETPSPTDENKEFDFRSIANDTAEVDDKDEMDIDMIECEEMEVPSPTNGDDTDEVTDEGQKQPKEQAPEVKTGELVEEPKTSAGSTSQDELKTSETTDESIPVKITVLETLLLDPPKPFTVSPSMSKPVGNVPSAVFNIVELEESSSEDDVQEVRKEIERTDVNIPKGIEVTASSGGSMSEIVTKEDELVISGVPKPACKKLSNMTRLNTSELTIKTCATESTLVIPETKVGKEEFIKPKMGLEVFSLDSDDDENTIPAEPVPSPPKPRTYKCVNPGCTNAAVLRASRSILSYYAVKTKKKRVCRSCARAVTAEQEKLVDGLLNFTPLLELDMEPPAQQLVEISDSDEEDVEDENEHNQLIGESGAKFLEAQLADMINMTWKKLNMDVRLDEVQKSLLKQMDSLQEESKEVDSMLSECQIATDKLRNELYRTFEHKRHELPAIVIIDTKPDKTITCLAEEEDRVFGKRRMSVCENPAAKRPAVPAGHVPVDIENQKVPTDKTEENKMDDDNTEVSVVKLCAETAPTSLPAVGEIIRPQLKIGQPVFAMRNAFGAWTKAKVMDITPPKEQHNQQFSMCRVKFEQKQTKSPFKMLSARCLAYIDPPDVRLTIGTRVIALFKNNEDLRRESYYSGVVAEIPNPVNKYRYLVFFDDGYAQYVQHQSTRLVVESSVSVWEEVHPFSRDFVRKYLLSFPERPMVRLHAGQSIKTEWNGKWWVSKVIQVDASLVQVHFEGDERVEWIYRGSTRLAPLYMELQGARGAARPARPVRRAVPRAKPAALNNQPYVEYTRSDEQNSKSAETQKAQQKQEDDIRRQRAVARKSTAVQNAPPAPTNAQGLSADSVTSRVVYYTPKNAVKPYKMSPHQCSPRCKRNDVLSLKELRTYNPLAKPLLSGWERQIVRVKSHRACMYRAPCGRRLRNPRELHAYLTMINSDMGVDLFDFSPNTHCLAEFVLNKCLVGKKDLSHGRENVPVPCVNYYDSTLPEFCSYNTERTPTAGVPLNLDPEFLCGCDCTDDCQDKSKCACWKMTLEGARTIGLGKDVGYVYRRLPEPLPSGIYECNSRCKCKNTCLNRVVQHPLQLKLQVFKTLNRGWGIRALNDVPKGSFLCIYAGNLLTDATANLDGLNEGDEYLAELDYIEVVEQMKEGYEDDIPEEDKELDRKTSKQSSEEEEEEESSSEEETSESKTEQDDDDFKPAAFVDELITNTVQPRKSQRRSKRKQEKVKQKEAKTEAKTEKKEIVKTEKTEKKEKNDDDDCITISDDEEVREPSRFMAQVGMDSTNNLKPKYNSVRSYFGKDEACYIMDAKVQGNIGRYLNHSCSPNVFVQNVFVDTHDPRFPWVAFFALTPIRAGSELTWNYNYDVGSVPDKILYCYCGMPNCRGRLL